MTIPCSVDEVTPAWLSAVLETDVTAVEVLDAHSGTTGRAKVRVETSADLPDTLFVKLQPFDEDQRAFLAMVGLGVSEAKLYGAVGPWLGTHALSPGDSPGAQDRMAMGASIVQSALDQFADDLPAEFRRLGEVYIARTRDIGSLWNEGERTLIHGDDHIGNLFVDAGRTGFYDWAVACQYPGMRDVAYFLCNSLPTEIRRAEEDGLIDRYRTGLAARGVTLDETLAREQYRLFSIYSWIAATTTYAMGSKWQPAEAGRRATDRTTQAIIDLDVLGLLADRL
jgi:hypothetical protein